METIVDFLRDYVRYRNVPMYSGQNVSVYLIRDSDNTLLGKLQNGIWKVWPTQEEMVAYIASRGLPARLLPHTVTDDKPGKHNKAKLLDFSIIFFTLILLS
mgnify:CR=1 FL=1